MCYTGSHFLYLNIADAIEEKKANSVLFSNRLTSFNRAVVTSLVYLNMAGPLFLHCN